MARRPTPWSIPSAAALAVLAGCSAQSASTTRDGPAELDHAPLAPQELSGEILYTDSILGMAQRLAVLEDKLIAIDMLGDCAIHVVSREDGRALHQFGRRGRGPGEYDGPWFVDPIPSQGADTFWIFDAGVSRLTRVKLPSGGGSPDVDSLVFVNLVSPTVVLDPVWIEGGFTSTGFFQNGRLGRFDMNGRLMRTMGPVPQTDGDYPPIVRQHAYQATLQPNPSRTMLAVASRHSDRLEIYHADGTLVKQVVGPFGFDPRIYVAERAGQVGMASDENLRFGYIDMATTDERIYVLFSGRTRWGFRREAPFGEFIHVYDWDGELREVLQLDAAAGVIAVDPQGEELYTAVEDPEPAIRAYSLRTGQ